MIDHVLFMVDGKNPSPVHLHFHIGLVPQRQPKTINSLIFPDKVCSIDPERRFLRRVASDPHDREVIRSDPYFSFEQVFVFAFGSDCETKQSDEPTSSSPARVNV